MSEDYSDDEWYPGMGQDDVYTLDEPCSECSGIVTEYHGDFRVCKCRPRHSFAVAVMPPPEPRTPLLDIDDPFAE